MSASQLVPELSHSGPILTCIMTLGIPDTWHPEISGHDTSYLLLTAASSCLMFRVEGSMMFDVDQKVALLGWSQVPGVCN